ncbi:DUF1214 domain-containing protein [Luteibacter sp. dw_328]|uniref:DUF1214 domain-containing protein n=1 Tax=Luteibacter sp. dw_328 TaxID=2719796 RepID=UPI001BD58650|nr:DUF1214 domain-containing protein [Luteibacter sp. dw_328]
MNHVDQENVMQQDRSLDASTSTPSDADIADAYLYLLGRLLVLRQEHLDFRDNGFQWNTVIHHEPGGVAWANPNLDVAYSEAWIGVDEESCTIVEVPEITGFYYTIQVLNGWGETTANINERNYPGRPFGKFAFCLKEAKVDLPPDTQRINLPSRKSRSLMRVELGSNPALAVVLQRQIRLYSIGKAAIARPVNIPLFANNALPGAEAFDTARAVLDSEADINPGMDGIRQKVDKAIELNASDRARVQKAIEAVAWPKFKASFTKLGTNKNGWNRPSTIGKYGDDWMTRTLINYAGIWANSNDEAVYFKTDSDRQGVKLDGGLVYAMTFPKDNLPGSHVDYFWSVIAVDSDDFRVIPNSRNRFLLNKESSLEYGEDGSLTLYFGADKPSSAPDGNWLPTPRGKNYNLTWRSYGPDEVTVSGVWFPPPLVELGDS